MNYEELIDAMACIVCYNSYEHILKDISDYIKYYNRDEFYSFAYPKKILKEYNIKKRNLPKYSLICSICAI